MAKPVDSPIEYDPDFKGPLDKRSCTDVLCLLVFVGAIAGWVVVALYAFKNGDSRLLLVPKDSEGRRCGVDAGLEDKPYLLFFDLVKCAQFSAITGCPTTQMCVEKCPEDTFIFNEKETPKISELICKPQVDKTKIKDFKEVFDKDLCARWYLPSIRVKTPAELNKHLENTIVNDLLKNVYKRCIPRPGGLAEDTIKKIVTCEGCNVESFWKAISNVKELNELSEVTQKIFEDVKDTRWHIFFGLIAGMLICLLYITILRFTVSLIVWTSLFGVITGLAYGFVMSLLQYIDIRNKPTPDVPLGTDETTIESILAAQKTWLILTWTTGIMWVIIVLLTWFLRRRIRLAIALIEEGSKAISTMRVTLCFPILPWVAQMVILIIGIACFMYITTIGDMLFVVKGEVNGGSSCVCDPVMNYTAGSACTVDGFKAACHMKNDPKLPCDDATCHYRGVLTTGNTKFLHGVNVVVCLWALFFLSAMGEMILAGTFATWYWTFDKRDVPFFSLSKSIYRTFRYHLGTIAFGALIITICRLIRVTLEYINSKLKKYDNGFVRAIMWCMRCFFYCLEKFLKFINRNAYIMCAIHGKNFCASAKDAFFLLVRNALRVFVLDKVTDFIFFVGKIFLTALVCYGAYFVFDKYPSKVQFPEVNYTLTPVIIIGFGTYCIASLFFVVYEMAVDTLFLCFLEDSERNDGSPSKPYYMSKNLMRILNKHNKALKDD